MRAHYLQHVPFEGLGSIEPWLKTNGYEITCTRLWESTGFPDLGEIDLLIVMGGPMSVNDEGQFPWLTAEKAYIRSAIESATPLLGVCLGAQLIASAMGASIYPNSEKEIGWLPIQGINSSKKSQESGFNFPPETTVFHWHGETFDLPSGATLLASSAACANQAFELGSAIGLQFHLETTPESAQQIVAHCRSELTDGRYIQSESEILSATPEHYAAINQLMAKVLAYLCRQ